MDYADASTFLPLPTRLSVPDASFDPIATLSETQKKQMDVFESLLERFNRRVNLVSPDTTSDIRTLHIRHCLSLMVRDFPEGAKIVDWGTGGGLPAVPLAIACPHVTVYAVDSVGKKVRAVRTFARRIGLDNLFAWNGRAEDWTGTAHYSISRATAPLADLWAWYQRVAEPLPSTEHPDTGRPGTWRPGLLCLKGGDLTDEIRELREASTVDVTVGQRDLLPLLGDEYFRHKQIVTVTVTDRA